MKSRCKDRSLEAVEIVTTNELLVRIPLVVSLSNSQQTQRALQSIASAPALQRSSSFECAGLYLQLIFLSMGPPLSDIYVRVSCHSLHVAHCRALTHKHNIHKTVMKLSAAVILLAIGTVEAHTSTRRAHRRAQEVAAPDLHTCSDGPRSRL